MGIPTSEGHGLLAAMAGSALALGGKVSVSDIIAIILWSIPAIFLGAFASYIFVRLFSSERERAGGRIFVIMCSALSSFFHGAQDGQKFFALAVCTNTMLLGTPLATVLFLGFFMALGTYFGGGRIIEKMENVAPDSTGPALISDLSGSLTLLILTLLGAPVSTTQVRSAALAAARLGEGKGVKRGDICLLLFAWAATLPICFSLGFLISKLIFVIIL
jgi:PiT family inorganic phosphate transporter